MYWSQYFPSLLHTRRSYFAVIAVSPVLTVFENADNERVVTLIVPPGSRRALLWPGQVETKVLGRSSFQYLLLVANEHLPADYVQLTNAEDYPV